MYVRSLYVQPEDDRTAAVIQKVIVSVADRVVMADTFGAALNLAFPGTGVGDVVTGGTAPSGTAPSGTSPSGTGSGSGSTGGGSGTSGSTGTSSGGSVSSSGGQRLATILDQITQKRDAANKAFGAGKFAEYAQLQSEIDALLTEMKSILTSTAPGTASSGSGSSGPAATAVVTTTTRRPTTA